MSFLGMGKSIAPMVSERSQPARLPPPLIVAMSFHRLFLGRLLSSRACPRFTGGDYFALPWLQLATAVNQTTQENYLTSTSRLIEASKRRTRT
jgi:hypothetical protein